MKPARLIAAMALALAGMPVAQAATYNLFDDFSTTANPNGAWSYGYASTPGGTFTPFKTSRNPVDGFATHAGLNGWTALNPATIGNVPAMAVNTTASTINDGNVDLPTGVVLLDGWPVNSTLTSEARWTTPIAGIYRIDATFTVRQANAEANVAVFAGSTNIFQASLQGDGSGVPYSTQLSLHAGDVLTFAVNRDSIVSGIFGNWTGLDLTISSVDPGAIVPQVGLWWNPAESGSGYALDYKHGVLVVTVYSYTSSGASQWYLSSGAVTDNTFTGTLDKYVNGQCISCTYPGRPPTVQGNGGLMTITFTSPTTATMQLPGGRNFQIVPQAF